MKYQGGAGMIERRRQLVKLRLNACWSCGPSTKRLAEIDSRPLGRGASSERRRTPSRTRSAASAQRC
jgi:hypothetical protein